MSYDSQYIDHRSGTNDPSDVGSASSEVVEVTISTPAMNWGWAHDGELYDWMDWHSPFPASVPSE